MLKTPRLRNAEGCRAEHNCGATGIAGPGVQPYVQIPRSIALGNGWALTGMETNFFTPCGALHAWI